MSELADIEAWAAAMDSVVADSARRQPYVSFADPIAARRNYARATRLSRAVRGREPALDHITVTNHSLVRAAHQIPIRRYCPPDLEPPAPTLLYFHGGSFVAGDLDTEHDRCARLAQDAHCAVVSVAYRLAPEHPFPAGVDDCYAALEWVAAAGSGPLAVGGSSAGATLAAATALLTRDRNGPPLALQLLLYPALDNRLDSPSMQRFPRTASWATRDSALMWHHYLNGQSTEPGQLAELNPAAVPARATDFTGLAPAYVLAAELDALRDEAIDYATRLMQAGVPVELHVMPRMFHGFDAALPEHPESTRTVTELAAAVRSALHPTAA